MRNLRRALALALTAGLLFALALGESGFPEPLRFTQTTETQRLSDNRLFLRTVPTTARPEVDAEIASLVDALAEAGRPFLPEKGARGAASRLDSGAYITRVGQGWMSFLVIGRVGHGGKQLWTDFATRVYDMRTGERITLDRVIGAAHWGTLAEMARAALAKTGPGEADPTRLDALCSPEALRDAAFTLAPGHLSLYFRADALRPERTNCLLRADLYYPDLRPLMTEEAIAETDCSGYPLVALTYDDGPAPGTSDQLIDRLRRVGAQATFFIIGDKIGKAPGILNREYDAGFSVQSHNWTHTYEGVNAGSVARWQERMDSAMVEVIGLAPTMMRAPGGKESAFVAAGSPLPQIHWSVTGGDNSGSTDVRAIGGRAAAAPDGAIVLLHDLDRSQPDFADYYLPRLEARGVMLVTLEDLFALRGLTLEPGMIVISADEFRAP